MPGYETRHLEAREAVMLLEDVLAYIIVRRPGVTVDELTRAVYGNPQGLPYVDQDCRRLVAQGRVRRDGDPGVGARYYPIETLR